MTSFVFLGQAVERSRTNFINLCRRFHMKARASFEFKDDAILPKRMTLICFLGHEKITARFRTNIIQDQFKIRYLWAWRDLLN
uniref:Uncharacterized protein n=1 Tax=Helicoverpa zea single nucleopolyhedrovirus TaxID=10468 RepID=A0A0H4AJF5_9ABAC|nr:hypothetical protein [Helicoverpa zea single nucleopolyhedrovirus]